MTTKAPAGASAGQVAVGAASVARAELARVRDPDHLLALALRSRHDAVLGALADRAALRTEPRAVVYRLLAGEELPGSALQPRTTVRFTLALATAWAGMGRSTRELGAAAAVYEQVLERCGPSTLRPAEQRHLAQAAFLAGRHALVEEALRALPRLGDALVAGLRADLANPVVAGPGALAHERWEELFGQRFVAAGLAAPQVDRGGACLFDGLRLPAGRSVDGPLVSVVMAAYRPDEALMTSLRSVLAQNHGNLEVLLVDDASGPGFGELFARAAALDDRVRVLRQECNGGPYLARNAALREARGEWVTTQDADDWSHPERIAAQLEGTAGRPVVVASRSVAIRCRPDLTRQWFGYSPERVNASALMVRRGVLQRVGGFDQIRKGADSELVERLRLRDQDAVVDVPLPLAVTRLVEGSLSRADFSLGRHSPERVLYRSAFRHWHTGLVREAARGEDQQAEAVATPGAVPGPPGSPEAGLAVERRGQQPHPVPRSFLRGLPGEEPPRTAYSLVVLADLAGPVPELCGDEVVGVLGREDLTRASAGAPTWSDALLDAGRDGRVDLLTDGDGVHAQTLVCLEPSLLALPALPLPRLTADRVLVVAPAAGPVRDLDAASGTARALTTTRRGPVWVARDEREQTAWDAEGWELPLLAEVLAGVAGGRR